MEQFFRSKQAYPDAILFFRMGDFYEMFYEDAVLASELLEIALTSRGQDESGEAIPMAGVPHHAATGYIARLVELGQSVAICEQMEDPSKVKGVVPREVVRVVTPGLVLEPDALDARSHCYLACVYAEPEGEGFGLAVVELSTSEARACRLQSGAELLAELVRLDAREVLLPDSRPELQQQLSRLLPEVAFRATAEQDFAPQVLQGPLRQVLDEAAADESGFGPLECRAATAALAYAQRSQPGADLDVQRIAPYDPSDQLQLDDAAVRNLELVRTLSGERRGSLLHLLDLTRTAMGARLLRRRLLAPLTDRARIRRRHDEVEALCQDAPLREALRAELSAIGDLERLSTRTVVGVASPRDLRAIANSVRAAERLQRHLFETAGRTTDDSLGALIPEDAALDVAEDLEAELLEEVPLSSGQGGIFRAEADARIAELRELSASSKEVILRLEARERERTGVSSLRVKFTRVFGYYIEVSKARLGAVPDDYRRKQTVANAERFTTPELDELQAKILNADERLRAIESERFEALRRRVAAQSSRLRRLASALANIDVAATFAELAHRHDYCRPDIDDSLRIDLVESRHPIVERMVESGDFVPNDLTLDVEGPRLMLITGPNMAGKSTAMRQLALCVIMAQAGGFVPAARARIGWVDRIYTRVGASDNVAQGESTFMVEMRETAAILRGATRRSLVVLDEIGRGTSTYDGLAIAWAVAEHLHDLIACRTVFATHYHELCELTRSRNGAVNFNVAAKEYGQDVVFLRKLVPGGANRSYGVAVARLAGVPEIVLARARAILRGLESDGGIPGARVAPKLRAAATPSNQLDFFEQPTAPAERSEVEETLRGLNLDRMTPLEALMALARLKELLGGDTDS